MTEEQRQAALEALDTIAEWANECRSVYVPDIAAHKTRVLEALQSPPVPAIEGLEEAIYYTLGLIGTALQETQRNIQLGHLTQADHEYKKADVLLKCVKAAEEYSKLQKGEQNGHDQS